RRRLELLARANQALASSLDVGAALTNLARTLVRDTADWCLIYATDADRTDGPTVGGLAHVDPARRDALDRLATLLPASSPPGSPFADLLTLRQAIAVPALTADDL